MSVLIHERFLYTSDEDGLTAWDLADPAAPVRIASVEDPSEPNPFTAVREGERMTGVCGGKLARSVTPRGGDEHWAERHSVVAVYDPALKPIARLSVGRRLDDRSLALSPDGARIASVSRGEGVVILDAGTGAVLAQFDGEIASGPSWSPDGRTVAAGDTGQAGGELYLLRVDTGERVDLPAPEARLPLEDSPFESAWSPDGARVAFTCAAWAMRGVVVYDAASGEELWSDTSEMVGGEDDEEEWHALRVAFACGGAVVLVGVEEVVRAYRAADGEPLADLPCDGDGGLEFAVDDARRCVWRVVDGEPVATAFPAEWVSAAAP